MKYVGLVIILVIIVLFIYSAYRNIIKIIDLLKDRKGLIVDLEELGYTGKKHLSIKKLTRELKKLQDTNKKEKGGQ